MKVSRGTWVSLVTPLSTRRVYITSVLPPPTSVPRITTSFSPMPAQRLNGFTTSWLLPAGGPSSNWVSGAASSKPPPRPTAMAIRIGPRSSRGRMPMLFRPSLFIFTTYFTRLGHPFNAA